MSTATISTRLWGQGLVLEVEFKFYKAAGPTEDDDIDLYKVVDLESGVDITACLHSPQEEAIYQALWELKERMR